MNGFRDRHERYKERHQRLIAAGRCQQCGDPRGPEGTTRRCRRCADQCARHNTQVYREKRGVKHVIEQPDYDPFEAEDIAPQEPAIDNNLQAIRSLACAVIRQALLDLQGPKSCRGSEHAEILQDAQAFTRELNDGLAAWCELAGVRPEQVVKAAARLMMSTPA